MHRFNEKRIELDKSYPVGKDEIIHYIDNSDRLNYEKIDDKTILMYIRYTRFKALVLAEVTVTSVGYILHAEESGDYQGTSMKEFKDDMKEVIIEFDNVMTKKYGESAKNREKLFSRILEAANKEESTKKLDEKRIDLNNLKPVTKEDVISFFKSGSLITYKEIDNKTIKAYRYLHKYGPEKGSFAEIELTSAGYVIRGEEGYDYQGCSYEEFKDDMNDALEHYDFYVERKKFPNKEDLTDEQALRRAASKWSENKYIAF